MRRWSLGLALLLACWATCANAKDNPPRWQINLKEKYGFESFDRPLVSTWTRQQDVVFLSPERVAVYQVSRARATAKLATRDASGGGGNYVLAVSILDARDGREIKQLRFPTNPEYSKIMATHDGKFIVRTGDVLYLYSADFERLASKNLPMKRKVIEEVWQIGVSPSGEEIALVHQQVFHRNQLTAESVVDSADADVEILNADTLQTTNTFSFLWFLHAWTAGENFLVSSAPQPSPNSGTFGLLNFEGKWSPLKPDWYSEKNPCSYQMEALDHQRFVAYGCGNLSVFPQSGEEPPASYRQTHGWTPLHFGPSSADVHSASLPRSVVVWSAVCGTQRYVRWEPTVHGDELCKAHQPLHRSSGENQNMKEPFDTTPSKSWYVTLGSTDRLASP